MLSKRDLCKGEKSMGSKRGRVMNHFIVSLAGGHALQRGITRSTEVTIMELSDNANATNDKRAYLVAQGEVKRCSIRFLTLNNSTITTKYRVKHLFNRSIL